MKAKKRIDFEKMFYAVCAIACFFLFWWFITAYTPAGETTPGPIEVIRLLIDSFFEPIGNYVITGHLLVSLRRVLVGFFVATILGIILGIGMGTSKWAEAIFKPVFELLRPIPPSPGSHWSFCSLGSERSPSTSSAASARLRT